MSGYKESAMFKAPRMVTRAHGAVGGELKLDPPVLSRRISYPAGLVMPMTTRMMTRAIRATATPSVVSRPSYTSFSIQSSFQSALLFGPGDRGLPEALDLFPWLFLAGPGILELLLEVSETFGHHAPSAKSGKLLILSHSYDGAAGAIGAGKRPGSAAGRSVCI
jgi:hypothetical protein